jgi:hypothetical protein
LIISSEYIPQNAIDETKPTYLFKAFVGETEFTNSHFYCGVGEGLFPILMTMLDVISAPT